MKTLGINASFLCICFCLSVSLYAQDSSVADTVALYKMSFEKADSLLIRLSREKTQKTKFSAPEISGRAKDILSAPESDTTVVVEDDPVFPVAADTLTGVVTTAEPVDSLSAGVSVVKSPEERTRQKAKVAKSELLKEQAGGGIRLREEEDDYRNFCSVNEGTVFGIGGYKMKDDYLSPEKYGGIGFRFMNERIRFAKSTNYKISRQNIVNVDLSSAINGAENANFLSAFVDYSLGYHYRFLPDPYFKIMVGGSVRGMLGMVYNTRNGNNPMTLHADLDLNLSLIAIREFRLKKHLLAVRYQFETPFAGVLFCPVYGQSYYEIFTLGNTAEVLNFNSFHNKFAMRNYLTLDFPVGAATCRVGYFGSCYTMNVHEIDKYIISHNIMIGFVKEFVPFSGRGMRKRNLFHSAYY